MATPETNRYLVHLLAPDTDGDTHDVDLRDLPDDLIKALRSEAADRRRQRHDQPGRQCRTDRRTRRLKLPGRGGHSRHHPSPAEGAWWTTDIDAPRQHPLPVTAGTRCR